MKRIFIYLALLTIGLSFSSCTEEIGTPVSDAGALTINLKSSELQTKTMEGVQELNENFIQTIHYFLYPNGGTGSNAVLAGSVNTNKQITESFTIPLDDNILNQLFPYPQTQCQVFLIVNLPTGVSVPQNTSINNLKTIALSASFTSKQDSFVMAGQGVATLDEDRTKKQVASGEIEVDRIAAKLTLNVNVAKSRTDNGTVWTPLPEDMTVSLYNCVNNAKLSGDPDAATSYFNITERGFSVVDGNTNYESSCDPFYSYPFKWNPGTESEPYFMIMLPWASEGQPYQRCYYKVILNGTQLEKNNWYNIDLMLDVLGSFYEKEPTVVVNNATYYVVNWSTGTNVSADIQGARYLVVEQEEYIVYNKQEFTIPFNTSHECVIVDATCSYPKYGQKNSEPTINYVTNYSLDIVNGNTIRFSHVLNNNMLDRNFDFTPYTVTFTIRHKDDNTGKFQKEITITQYPAIYVEAYYNTDNNASGQGKVWVNGYNDNSYNRNNTKLHTNGQDYFAGADGNQQGADRRMFVFTITTTEGTNLVIGDPRDTEYTYDASDAQSIGWYSGAALYEGNNRELKYYYGTKVANEAYSNGTTGTIYVNDAAAEAAEPTINMMAPKFRLASGYGTVTETTNANNLEMMKRRCASYQEDGYPAGRWRLPTKAEFQFILTQINYGNLPGVYLSSYNYWCAHGLGDPDNNGLVQMQYVGQVNSGQNFVRCVYDEWYWENSETYRLGTTNANGTFVPSDTFTWGDMPRSAFDLKTE